MISLILGIILFVLLLAASFIAAPKLRGSLRIAAITVPLVVAVFGSFAYNKPGTCSHVRTIFNSESGVCQTGWYFAGWGQATEWPHYITVSNNSHQEGDAGLASPREIKMADNWKGLSSQSTIFAIPLNEEEFLILARRYRNGPEPLIIDNLRPTVNATLDSVANMYTMEDYYAGGQRDAFKTEYELAVKEGRAEVYQRTIQVSGNLSAGGQRAGATVGTEDSAELGGDEVRRIITEKRKGPDGKDIRVPHAFKSLGIRVEQAIFEGIEPDPLFEERIQARKEAASRRVIAREQRLEQEEQRLLAMQAGETEIAKRQAEARVEQIGLTTNAETQKKLALIENERQLEAAKLLKQTAEVTLERTRIEADGVRVKADAEAHAKKAVLEADGALQAKLDAWLGAQHVWADATSKMAVPQTVIGAAGGNSPALNTVDTFMQMMMTKTAKDLAFEPTIASEQK